MKVLFILEAGIPEYRNFLFEQLSKEEDVSEFLVIHNGRMYNGSGDYDSKKLKFLGNNKFGFYLGLWKYIRKYDVIVSSYNLRILSCWLPVFFNKKWIFWGKGLGSNESNIIKELRKVTAKKCSSILVYNEFKKNELVNKLNIDKEKVVAYNNTIEITNSGFSNDQKRNYLLYFGRIQERKGLLELVIEYKKYVDMNASDTVLKLKFVGNGNYKATLENEVTSLGLNDYVEFHAGVYEDEGIKNHFDSAKAYVSPFNVGLAVVNSFSYGVPVITCVSPQVGPEYHYLNEENSFIGNEVKELHKIFDEISSLDSENIGNRISNFYRDTISSNVMYSHFYNTIKKVFKDE